LQPFKKSRESATASSGSDSGMRLRQLPFEGTLKETRRRPRNAVEMGVTANTTLLADAVGQAQTFVHVFVLVYTLVILAYILTSWLKLPYSPWLNRIQRFLYDVSEPYLRLFRRVLPPMGPLDLSPMIGIIVLVIIDRLLQAILAQFH
jgi:uncharacterized protein YggT (Ycf19 family)